MTQTIERGHMDKIVVNDVTYVPEVPTATRRQIVVLHRGFVFMGDVERLEKEIIIHHAQNIRKWGTTTGLGQIAISGPTEKTVLDPSGTVRCHPLAEVCSYDCTY